LNRVVDDYPDLDALGRNVNVGDYVLYCDRVDREMQLYMNIGKVLEFEWRQGEPVIRVQGATIRRNHTGFSRLRHQTILHPRNCSFFVVNPKNVPEAAREVLS
jgi:hypothetical protein